jgi:short-subunit dehydrogenase
LDEAHRRGFNTTATFRNNHSKVEKSLSTDWVELDLRDFNSIRNFELSIENKKFDLIISLIGKTLINDVLEPNLQQIRNYFDTYVTNLSHVLKHLSTNSLKTSENSSLIYVSSRAVRGSYDMYYSAAKAAIEAFIRSIGLRLSGSNLTYIVNCGLIVDSEMFLQMREQNRAKHRVLAEKPLVTVSEFSRLLFQELEHREKSSGIVDLQIGPRY